jgi:hypothetical protein
VVAMLCTQVERLLMHHVSSTLSGTLAGDRSLMQSRAIIWSALSIANIWTVKIVSSSWNRWFERIMLHAHAPGPEIAPAQSWAFRVTRWSHGATIA